MNVKIFECNIYSISVISSDWQIIKSWRREEIYIPICHLDFAPLMEPSAVPLLSAPKQTYAYGAEWNMPPARQIACTFLNMDGCALVRAERKEFGKQTINRPVRQFDLICIGQEYGRDSRSEEANESADTYTEQPHQPQLRIKLELWGRKSYPPHYCTYVK